MAYNDSRKKATNKYRDKFDLIQIRVEQGKREIIAAHAEANNESMNHFITRAICEAIERDENEKV